MAASAVGRVVLTIVELKLQFLPMWLFIPIRFRVTSSAATTSTVMLFLVGLIYPAAIVVCDALNDKAGCADLLSSFCSSVSLNSTAAVVVF